MTSILFYFIGTPGTMGEPGPQGPKGPPGTIFTYKVRESVKILGLRFSSFTYLIINKTIQDSKT